MVSNDCPCTDPRLLVFHWGILHGHVNTSKSRIRNAIQGGPKNQLQMELQPLIVISSIYFRPFIEAPFHPMYNDRHTAHLVGKTWHLFVFDSNLRECRHLRSIGQVPKIARFFSNQALCAQLTTAWHSTNQTNPASTQHQPLFTSTNDQPTSTNEKHSMLTLPRHLDVSKNRGTPKWMVYNGKPY